jgi:D-alanyl-lipoteichoic acid acyltransferase DltB (MBOAT superfamily)
MVFHSVHYLLFLAASVLAYYATPSRARWIPLLAASWAFYACWRFEFIFVLASITAIQYILALRMGQEASRQRRRPYLLAALIAGLGVLVYFKYATAIRLGLAAMLPWLGASSVPASAGLLVPIGISFYTLQTIGYLIDVYYGRREPEKHFGIFAVFVGFFPIVVSGPIERAGHLLPQLQRDHSIAFLYENISQGVKLIIWGFFLKLVIADRAALYVDAVFGHPDRHSGVTFLLATIFYSFQVYCDFAGYSSVAIGSAKLLGIDILPNFNRPYLALSIKDFWRRWHMTLSNWLRDYVFLPLGYALSRRMPEERYGSVRVDRIIYVAAILVTFALCGLWHGPNTTFLVWGCFHGLCLAVENSFRIRPRLRVLHIARTYGLVLISWIVFRANTVPEAFDILRKILTAPGRLFIPPGPDVVAPLYAIGGIALLMVIELKREFYRGPWTFFGHRNEYVRVLAYGLVVALIISMGVFDGGQFIYAQF